MECSEPGSEELLCLLITGDHLLQRVVRAWRKRVHLTASHRTEGPWFTREASSWQRCQQITQRAERYYYVSTECDRQLFKEVRAWVWLRHRLTAVCRALKWSNPSRPFGAEPCYFASGVKRWEEIFLAAVKAQENKLAGSSSSSSEPLLTEQHQRIAQAVFSSARGRLLRDFQWRKLLQVFEAWGQAARVPPTALVEGGSGSESDDPPDLVSDDSSTEIQCAYCGREGQPFQTGRPCSKCGLGWMCRTCYLPSAHGCSGTPFSGGQAVQALFESAFPFWDGALNRS